MTRRLVLLLLCIVSLVLPAQASTILEATDSTEVVTSSAAALDYNASFADYGTNRFHGSDAVAPLKLPAPAGLDRQGRDSTAQMPWPH